MQIIYKKRGETPLECIDRLREEQPELRDAILSYAGRLDPMAEGVLLILVGDENKNREKYLHMEKEYTYDVLFGFATDTYDILGKLTDAVSQTADIRVSMKAVLDASCALKGKRRQEYPPYSSKTVHGKPLFEYAREGKLDAIEIPTQEIEIFENVMVGMQTITAKDLWSRIDNDIAAVHGDFRQKEIRDCWWEHLRALYGQTFDVATLRIRCSAGTYVRSLANCLGTQVGIPALAFRIIRTRVGEYTTQHPKV